MEKQQTSKKRTIVLNVLCGLGVALLTALLIVCSPLRRLVPGYLPPQSREQVINFALRVDSLEEAVARQNMYVTNLQDVLKGRVRVDTMPPIDTLTALRASDLMEQTEREKEFARQYEETEKYNLTTQASRVGNVQGLNLTVPVRGLVQRTFDPNNYFYGVDVAATAKAPVCAILEGTVLASSYSVRDGYFVIIQHNGDLISTYAHLGSLIKKQGDKVKAGEAIASMGEVDGEQAEATMHFELWHKGVAIDPTIYIAF